MWEVVAALNVDQVIQVVITPLESKEQIIYRTVSVCTRDVCCGGWLCVGMYMYFNFYLPPFNYVNAGSLIPDQVEFQFMNNLCLFQRLELELCIQHDKRKSTRLFFHCVSLAICAYTSAWLSYDPHCNILHSSASLFFLEEAIIYNLFLSCDPTL